VVISAVHTTLHSSVSMNVCPVFEISKLFLEKKFCTEMTTNTY